MFILSLLLGISVALNIIFVWYTRKLIYNLNSAVNGMDEMQKLFTEYANFLEPLANLENYYGEPAIDSARANTSLIIEACKVYKKSILENYDEENQENKDSKENEKTEKEDIPKRGAVISSIKS
jgi:hypothetical protein